MIRRRYSSGGPQRSTIAILLCVANLLSACNSGIGAELPLPARLEVIGTSSDGRREVRCSELRAVQPVVFLAFGQSIASNFNQAPHTPERPSYNIHQGRCFEARDPMAGADGTLGSMWSYLADALPGDLMPYTAFVTIGVGASSVAQWDAGGSLNAHLTVAVRATRDAGFEISYLLWHQGSADRGTTEEAYQSHFRGMIRSIAPYGVLPGSLPGNARVLIAVHTRCGSGGQDVVLAAAQRGLVDPDNGFFPGADTDTVSDNFRYDGCHLSKAGQEKAALLWRDRIMVAARHQPR
ncbi:sialate O-acetylesterase [uncultured Nevskia sp.]|uniref:sialate O-acetylesterase n=1 Tax=uncultured Nevskia sp. TaxID=228950 RepID=UPI0025F1A8D8|nr:sialate O-acetylesterase [uncultured Nevskia sp.]